MLSSSASLISAKRLARSEARCPHSEEDAQWASHELVALRAEVERLRPLEHEVERLRAENEAHKDKAERLQAEVENLRALAAGFRPTRASSNEGSDSAAETEVEQENADSVCTFTFVSAAYLRGLPDNAPPLPSFQELKKVPGALVRRTLDRDVAYRGGYAKKQLAVSHRWEHPSAPDTQGEQQRKIIAHLLKHEEIEDVWFDHWCMAQGERTPKQQVWFDHNLMNVNLLYLGTRVLVLADISYLSRFWTQFEAWLSMQAGSTEGLGAASKTARRYTIECLHNATAGNEDVKLVQMWERATPSEAHALLSKPDVVVTNQGDKDMQLRKIEKIDSEVRGAWDASSARALREAGASATDLPLGFAAPVLLEAGYAEEQIALSWLAHGDPAVRHAAAQRLIDLPDAQREELLAALDVAAPAAYAPNVLHALQQLEDSKGGVREAAVRVLGKLDAPALAAHAAAAVAKLEDANKDVRYAAVQTLWRLDAPALATHATALIANLEDPSSRVRAAAVEALGRLDAPALAAHAAAVVAKLEDADGNVRQVAVEALGRLDAPPLATHAAAVVVKLEDSDGRVRKAAAKTLGKLDKGVLTALQLSTNARIRLRLDE